MSSIELDPVVETFAADVAPWLAGIEEAIRVARDFRDTVYEAAAAVEALNGALDSLPLERTIHLRVDTSGMPEAAAAAAASGGTVPDAEAAWVRTQAILGEALAGYEDLAAAADAAQEAQDAAAARAAEGAAAYGAEAVAADAAAGALRGYRDAAATAEDAGVTGQPHVWPHGAWEPAADLPGQAAAAEAARSLGDAQERAAQAARDYAGAQGEAAAVSAADAAATGDAAVRYQALADAMGRLAAQRAAAAGEAGVLAAAQAAAAAAAHEDAAAQGAAGTALEEGSLAALRAARSRYLLAAADRMEARTAQDAARAEAQAAGRGGFAGFLKKKIPVFGGALAQMGVPGWLAAVSGLHLLIDGFAELAAVVVPATVAFGAFGIAAVPTLQDIYTHMKAVYTTSQALGQNLYPLTGGFQAVADAVRPEVLTLFGEALIVVTHNTGAFQAMATGAGHALDQLGARAAAALTSGGMGHFLANGPADLAKLGDVAGNVFGILGNLLKTMPGYAETLLGAFGALTHAVEWLTATPVAQWMIGAGLAFHGAVVWLGLGATAAVAMGNALVGLAAKLGLAEEGALAFDAAQFGPGIMLLGSYLADTTVALVTFAGAEETTAAATGALQALMMTLGAVSPFVWVGAAVTGLVALTMWLGHARSATQSYDNAVNSALGNAPVTQLGTDLAQQHAAALGQVQNAQLALNSTQQYGTQINTHTGQQVQVTTYAYQHAQSVLAGYRGELAAIGGYQKNYNTLLKAAGGNLTFLSDAGITSNQIIGASAAQMAQYKIEVQAAADAQKALALGTGQAAAANNAQTNAFMTQTLPAMQKVTQAEDAVMSVITSGQTAFDTFEQGIYTLAQNLNTATGSTKSASFTLSHLKSSASLAGAALGGTSQASYALNQAFYAEVQSGQQLIDSLRQQHISAGQLKTVVGTTARQMLGFAGTNTAARSVLVSLINNALGPGTVSLKNLNSWVKTNSTSLQGMNGIIAASTIQAGSLAGVLQSQLNTQFHQALLKESGAASELQKYTWMLVHNKGATAAGQGVRAQLIRDLEMAGLSARQAAGYVNGLSASLRGIPKNTTVTVTTYNKMINVPGSTAPGPWASGYVMPKKAASGWKVPGHGSGDTVPAMLTPGEAVVPKHLVPAVAPFLAAHHVPGFAAGGIAAHPHPHGHGHGHGHPWDMGDVMALWLHETWGRDLLRSRGPIGAREMARLLASFGTSGRSALAHAWERYSHGQVQAYAVPDLKYWKIIAERHALARSEHAQITHLRHMITVHQRAHQGGWVKYYERQLTALEAADAKKRAGYGHALQVLAREIGVRRSEWLYRPPHERRRHHSGSSAAPVHVHLHGDLSDRSLWERMQVETLDYGYFNSGQPEGIWQPGG